MTDDLAPQTGPDASNGAPATYEIRIVGSARTVRCAPGQDILAAAIRSGADWLPIGCRGGGCGVCRISVRSGSYETGRMAKRHVTGDSPGRLALACRVYPSSDLVIELAPIVKKRPAA